MLDYILLHDLKIIKLDHVTNKLFFIKAKKKYSTIYLSYLKISKYIKYFI